MNEISFKKFVKTGIKMFIENVFSDYISCIFCDEKIIFYENMKNVITPEFRIDNLNRNKIVQKFNLDRYENTVLLFDSNYMIFIYFEDEYKKDKIINFLLWDFILERFMVDDSIYNSSSKKVLLYKFKNDSLKL